mmetsp:Transcript_10792/g.17763  ORF Transcript_10792/g.17763 Transcript_10792/m.17763 type:complete len:208 (+) Transcript_10792:613-1236(+)
MSTLGTLVPCDLAIRDTCCAARSQTSHGSQFRSTMPSGLPESAKYCDVKVSIPIRDRKSLSKKPSTNVFVSCSGSPFARRIAFHSFIPCVIRIAWCWFLFFSRRMADLKSSGRASRTSENDCSKSARTPQMESTSMRSGSVSKCAIRFAKRTGNSSCKTDCNASGFFMARISPNLKGVGRRPAKSTKPDGNFLVDGELEELDEGSDG